MSMEFTNQTVCFRTLLDGASVAVQVSSTDTYRDILNNLSTLPACADFGDRIAFTVDMGLGIQGHCVTLENADIATEKV